ncbi:MAG: SRPBCC family protein [Pseudomonadota bacterium]|nr:SRPBCC family protein [Pseudomonadota bacterium]
MKRDKQLQLIRRLLSMVEDGSTSTLDTTWQNELSAYTDPARHARERTVFFRERPVPVGLSGLVAKPGDYVTETLDDMPVVIVRGKDGIARAFMNVCRHRGAPVAEGCGSGAKMFACPYHAWTYNLDGSLKGIPDARSFAGLDKSAHGLRQIPLAERNGILWLGPVARGVEPVWQDPALEEELAEWDFGSYHLYDRVRRTWKMNWKIAYDTFLEGYHISALHKDTIAPLLESNRSTFDAFGEGHRLVVPRRNFRDLKNVSDDEAELVPYSAVIYGLFPSGILAIQGAANVELWRMFPNGANPGECVVELASYIPEAPKSEKQERFWRKNFDLALATVEAEDFTLGERIQKNAESGEIDHVVYGRNEPAMTHFHTGLRRALGLNAAP